jgi:hypothetical protein
MLRQIVGDLRAGTAVPKAAKLKGILPCPDLAEAHDGGLVACDSLVQPL